MRIPLPRLFGRMPGPCERGVGWQYAMMTRDLEWCIDNGINVVNLSLSTSNDNYYSVFHELCDRAAFARVMVVSARNNERKATYPSEFSSVFSVAATAGQDLERYFYNPCHPLNGVHQGSTSTSPGSTAAPSTPPGTASPRRSSPAILPASWRCIHLSRHSRPRPFWRRSQTMRRREPPVT